MTPEGVTPNRLRAEDEYELFAWLDFGVAKGWHPNTIKHSLVDHLGRTRQKDFTLAQIDERLHYLWRHYGCVPRTDDSKYSSVYSLGTKALRYLDFRSEVRQIVRKRVQQLMRDPAFNSSKSARKRSRRRRRRKHVDPGVEGGNRPFLRAKTATRESPSRNTAGSIEDSITVHVSPPSKTAEDSPSKHSSVTLPDSERPESTRSSTTSSINGVTEGAPMPGTRCASVNPEIFLTPAKKQKLIHLDDVRPLTTLIVAQHRSTCGECDTIRQLLADRERDVQYFSLEWSKAQDTIRRLERERRCEGNQQAILKKSGGVVAEDTLKSYLDEVENLRSKIEDKECLVPFTTRGRKHMPFDEKYFQENLTIIGHRLEDFLACAETLRTCNEIDFRDQQEDLCLLFERIVGGSDGWQSFSFDSVSFHSLLRSLLCAAVCEWVLECDVQEPYLANTAWKETALSYLATQDGEDVARNLDFAVHHGLVESQYYQHELIPRRAEALVDRLSATLTPLFGLHKPLEEWEEDILNEWDRKRPELHTIFVCALRIKARALVSKDMFEVVFPVPRDKYDPGLMKVEMLSDGDGPMEQKAVRLCLVPGLRKYTYDRKRVDYNSFSRPGSSSDGPSDLIAKPIVIID